MSRGGKRTGTPGKSYGQRVDLNEAPSGGQYGDKAAAQSRIDAVPMTAAAPAGPAAPSAPLVPPGALNRPTERPMEPITAGLPTGPGPGPEALGLGDAGNLEKLRPMLPVLELLASRPEAGSEARNLVRRLRGALGTTPSRSPQPGSPGTL